MRHVFYLMSYQAHLPYLACSLVTLRKHWDGPVTVFAWKESWDIVHRISQDRRLLVDAVKCEPAYRGKNDQFLHKIAIAREATPGSLQLYLDADTTIHGKLDPLFDAAELFGFAATQFCDWTTGGSIPQNRLKRLADCDGVDKELLALTLRSVDMPSVNGGVWACRPESPVLPDWYEQTWASRNVFIADECVLHLMTAKHGPLGNLRVLTGGRWNCSPMRFQPANLPDRDVIIRHFHGDSATRIDKSPKGNALWQPIWERCLVDNIGGAREWGAQAAATNRWMKNKTQEIDDGESGI